MQLFEVVKMRITIIRKIEKKFSLTRPLSLELDEQMVDRRVGAFHANVQ